MRRRSLFPISVLVISVAAGCSAPRSNEGSGARLPPAAAGARPASANDRLLVYYEHVRKLPSAELAKEHDAVRQLYANANSDSVRLRYAMLLSIPGTVFNDDARALEALEPLLRNPNAALHNLAFLLNAQIQEQRRGQGLQQKLEALKSLEQSLIERDPGAGKRR